MSAGCRIEQLIPLPQATLIIETASVERPESTSLCNRVTDSAYGVVTYIEYNLNRVIWDSVVCYKENIISP